MKSGVAKKTTAKKTAAPPSEPGPTAAKRRTASPPPAVNEPLSFITFVATYPVGTTVEGEVVSFTSHGAMVDVVLPDGGYLHCYIPLSAMGDPPPTKARQVLTKGEVRPFVLSSLDPPRRVAELSLPVPPVKKRRSPAKKAAKATT
jgi:ribosomal protein S1